MPPELNGLQDALPDRRAGALQDARQAALPKVDWRSAGLRRDVEPMELTDEAAVAVAQSVLPDAPPAGPVAACSASEVAPALEGEAAACLPPVRSAEAGAGPKEPGRGEFRPKESAAWAAKADAAVAAALKAPPADEAPVLMTWMRALRGATQPVDESERRGPGWAGAAGSRVACLRPAPPASSVLPATLLERRAPYPWLRAQRAPQQPAAWEARQASPASGARRALLRRWVWSLPGQASRPERAFPLVSALSLFQARTYRRRNSAAVSRRCHRRSNWNGSTPR